MIKRKEFFAAVRKKPFGGQLTVLQVQGMEVILNAWETRFWQRTSVPQMAVMLATAYHETGHTMQPIMERGGVSYFTKLYDVAGNNPTRARKYGNIRRGDGARYCGRGFVQLTWFDNYDKATKRLRELKLIGPDIDFTKNPELVMHPDYAVLIMFIGMEEGWFTGQKLDDIVDDKVDGDEHADAIRSRKIINGKDRDQLIAGYAMDFLKALVASVDSKVLPPPPPAIPPKQAATGAEHEVAGAAAWNKFWTAVGGSFRRV
jgi:putative chitinase